MTPCHICRTCLTRAASEYLARGRRRALGNAFGVVLALVLMAVGAALVTRNGPSAPVRSRHV